VADSFIGRWSRRKQEVRSGVAPQEPVPAQSAEPGLATATKPLSADTATATGPQQNLPTLEDVQALTSESDFKPFVARGVDPEVRNAAMKKLFADPHYNVMDRLDTYIDDYSIPDPIPAAMLRQLASAKFLDLFDEEKNKLKEKLLSAQSVDQPPAELAQVQPAPLPPVTNPPDHDHTDLRLQQDDAAGAKSSGGGAG
jgi:hypothetical protein